MYLKLRKSGDLVEIMDEKALINPCQAFVAGRLHAGEEIQGVEQFRKSELTFPSGENMPACWINAEYKSLQTKLNKSVV